MSELYRLIHAEKATYPIVLLCRVLKVARSSYYAWREGEAARRVRRADDDALAHEITVLHIASRHTYGVPRVHAELRRLGRRVNRKRRAASDGMRRLLRQQASESGPTRIAGHVPNAPVELSPGAHPRIVLEVSEHDPAEALCQIPRMDFAALAALVPADEERQLRVVRIGERWMTYFVRGQSAVHAWNPESRTWDQARDDSTG
ncbi:IS3 family transposase [Streptomyces sp. E5N91]|uniref:IS3 family transposase n=1 Tax=Streptomyces sp. E5N91 TaxID=1851996 RepID=UPI000EF55ECA|nr:IS3 family transposase [Streptomyces sp. E5N91]